MEMEDGVFEVVVQRGCVYLVGDLIERVVRSTEAHSPPHHQPPTDAITNRHARDNDPHHHHHHHVTLIHRTQAKHLFGGDSDALLANARDFFAHWLGGGDGLQSLAGNTLASLGIAVCADSEKNRAYFIPILWPCARAFLASLGLPAHDFHITLGFIGSDVHGVRKCCGALMQSPSARASLEVSAFGFSTESRPGVFAACLADKALSELNRRKKDGSDSSDDGFEMISTALLCVDVADSVVDGDDRMVVRSHLLALASRCFGRQSLCEKSLESASAAAECNPQSRGAATVHGRALAAVGRVGEAKGIIERAMELPNPDGSPPTATDNATLASLHKACCNRLLPRAPPRRARRRPSVEAQVPAMATLLRQVSEESSAGRLCTDAKDSIKRALILGDVGGACSLLEAALPWDNKLLQDAQRRWDDVDRASANDDAPSALFNPRCRQVVSGVRLPNGTTADVRLPRNFSWVIERQVCGCATPESENHVRALHHLGVTLVVTLTEERPLPQNWFVGAGVANLFVPVPNYEPPSVEQADTILEAMEAEMARGGAAVVHCGGGKGRAGTVLACWALKHGFSPLENDDGEAKISADGGSSLHCSPAMSGAESVTSVQSMRPGSIETRQQENFLRDYARVLWARAGTVRKVRSNEAGGDARQEAGGEGETAKTATTKTAAKKKKKLKPVKLRLPKFVMLVGLPGSGKSTFSTALRDAAPWVYISQDEIGSRRECEDLVGRTMRQSRERCVLDRCNVTVADRRIWLDLAYRPADAECVFFDVPADECVQRAMARTGHATIKAGSNRAVRAVQSFAKQLERPQISEGFRRVNTVSSQGDLDALLRRFGATGGTQHST